jgi:2-iminobutanoate/2-iminopropanoate deaminase
VEKEIKINHEAPTAIGPYSHALKIGNLVFASGQIPIDPETGEIVEGGIEKQTKQSLQNLKAVLKPYSIDFSNIVKVTIFLKDMNDFPRVNEMYSQYFDSQFPARSCIEVARLPKDAQIEIEAIAYCDEK